MGNILVLALQVQAGDKNRILQKMLTHFGGKKYCVKYTECFPKAGRKGLDVIIQLLVDKNHLARVVSSEQYQLTWCDFA